MCSRYEYVLPPFRVGFAPVSASGNEDGEDVEDNQDKNEEEGVIDPQEWSWSELESEDEQDNQDR